MKKIISIFAIFACLPFAARAEIASQAYVDERDNTLIFGTNDPDSETVTAVETYEGVNYNGLLGWIDDVNESISGADGLDGRINELENTVGDDNSGLVRDVSDLVSVLGDSNDGLLKDVADLQDTVGDSTDGLVKDVADLQTTVGDSTDGLVKDVAALQGSLDASVGMKQYGQNGIMVTDAQGNVKVATGGFITNDKISSSAAIEMGKIALPTPPAACQATGGSCSLIYVGGTGYVWEMLARDTGESAPTAGAVSATATATNPYTGWANPASCQGAGASWDGSDCAVIK